MSNDKPRNNPQSDYADASRMNPICEKCPVEGSYCFPLAFKPMAYCTNKVLDIITAEDAFGKKDWAPYKMISASSLKVAISAYYKKNPIRDMPIVIRYLFGKGDMPGVVDMAFAVKKLSARKIQALIFKSVKYDEFNEFISLSDDEQKVYIQNSINEDIMKTARSVIKNNFRYAQILEELVMDVREVAMRLSFEDQERTLKKLKSNLKKIRK